LLPKTIPIITTSVRCDHNPGDTFICVGLQWLWEHTLQRVLPWLLINKFNQDIIKSRIPSIQEAGFLVFGGTPQYNNYKDWKFWYDDGLWTEVIIPNKIPVAVLAGGSGFPDANMTPEQFADYCTSDPETVEIIKRRAIHALCFTTRDLHSHYLLNKIGIENKYLPCTATFAARYLPVPTERPFIALVPPSPNSLPDPYVTPGMTKEETVKTGWLELFRALQEQGKNPVMVCHWYREYELFKTELNDSELFYSNDYAAFLRFYTQCNTVISARLHGVLPAYGILGTRAIGVSIDTRGHAVNIFPKIPEITYDKFKKESILELLPNLQPSSEDDFTAHIQSYGEVIRGILSKVDDLNLPKQEEPVTVEETKVES